MWYPFAGRPLPGLDFFRPASFRSLHSWCSVVILISLLSWDPFHQVVVLSLSIASLTAGLQTWGPGPSSALLLANLGKTMIIILTWHYIKGHISVWQGFHFVLLGTQFFAWRFLSILSLILEGFKRDATKILGCLDRLFNFWPFLVVGKPTSLWQKLYWDNLWMEVFFMNPLQFKRLWVVPSWHEWGTHCAKTG